MSGSGPDERDDLGPGSGILMTYTTTCERDEEMIAHLSSQITSYQSERRAEAETWRLVRQARVSSSHRQRGHRSAGSPERSARS